MVEKEKEEKPWAKSPNEVFSYLKSSKKGLSDKEAVTRLKEFGKNEIASKNKRYGINIFFSQFKNAFVLILMGAVILSYFFGETINATVILVMIFLTALFGFFQEYKAEKTIRELKKYITIKAKVLRDNDIIELDSKELVLGDIVYLDIGEIIPADLRLIEIEELSSDESILTGESVPVSKIISAIDKKFKMPQDLHNMVFMGASVSGGRGSGVVTATGRDTFFGKTASYLKEEIQSEFQKNIKKFSNFVLKVIIIMTLFVFAINAFLQRGIIDSFLFALALAIGITPEILPIIMTVALSNGAIKMAKQKVVVKKLSSIEDLGNIDTLCCDKTGTLTEGKLALQNYVNLNEKKDDKVLLYGLLCNSVIGKQKKLGGDSIDLAIWQNENADNLEEELNKYKVLGKNELDFERRRMSILIKNEKENSNILIVKGAAESVTKVCKSATFDGRKILLTKNSISKITNKTINYEKNGYKVIAIAEKQTKNNQTEKADERELNLIGFLLFLDPAKETAKESLETYQKLGVEIKILSGDSPTITKKICNDVGLKIFKNKIILGDELDRLNESEFEEYIIKYNVFARVTPEQKYKLVKSLNKEGHIVGFLGDGINDAPALKAADVGISVDSGAEIAKDASDIILLQKDLHVLAYGIIEGRKTFGNIMKYILNTISSNYGNMFTLAGSSLFLSFIPLLPPQILLSNLLSDTPDLTISTDNVDEEMLKKPKKWSMKLISRFMIYFGLFSFLCDLALILTLLFIFKAPTDLFRTALFIETTISEIMILFAVRTKRLFFKSKPSKLLMIITLLVSIATIAITFTAFGGEFFGFVKLPAAILITIFAIWIFYFITVDIAKRHFFKKFEI